MRRFEEQLAQAWPERSRRRINIVVAVSGGADSVALLRGLVSSAGSAEALLVVAHFNHRLRLESDDDAVFVRDLCQRLHVRFELGVAGNDLAAGHSGSIEEAARNARYDFLTEVARRTGARYIATAHTADDQAETILHRLLRGTGIRGLAGIPTCRELVPGVSLIRPLLDVERSEVISYLNELDQPFRTDATNLDNRFTRNRIRSSLLPMLRDEYNPHVADSLRRLGKQAEEMSRFVESVAEEQIERGVQLSKDVVSIDLQQLRGISSVVVRTMLRKIWRAQGWPEREMTFERWHKLEQLTLDGENTETCAAITLPTAIHAERSGNWLAIKSKGQP